jgi:transcriptional regulator with XRE-family HTH domain
MAKQVPAVFPAGRRRMEGLGERLRLARLRRRFSATAVAERAGISRATLSRAEAGDPAVAIGIIHQILEVLMLERDLDRVALDDELGRKLQDLQLPARKRAPRSKPTAP